MKKSLLYTIIGGACLLTTTSLTLIANGVENTNRSTNSNQPIVATTSNLEPTSKSFTNDETVYVITDNNGNPTKSFINNTLNTSEEPIPVYLHITYFLDGNEITANDLAHKSGHVKIVYDFSATEYFNDKKVPFLAITGLLLDSHVFSNITTTNGKIINETENKTIITGYAVVGLGENLDLDLLPTSFSIEADTTDFSLDTAYTLATNEIFANLDTSKLGSIDDIITQMNQLGSGMDQLINGANRLYNGLDSALSGTRTLQAGLNALLSGTNELTSGANTLASGAHELSDGATRLSDGLDQLVAFNSSIVGKIDEATATVEAKIHDFTTEYAGIIAYLSTKYPELASRLTEVVNQIQGYYDTAHNAITTYTGNIETIADGAATLKDGTLQLATGADALAAGSAKLSDGTLQLSLGSSTLINGLEQLSAGSHTLYDGLVTFNDQGISKLVNFANNDLSNLISNIHSTVSAAKSYHHYSNSDAKSVKFIFKTPSIK